MSIHGIDELLEANDVDPNQTVETDSGPRTAREIAEAYLMAAFDEIED